MHLHLSFMPGLARDPAIAPANQEGGSLEALMRESLIEPLVPASARAAELGVPVVLPEGFDSWFASAVAREPSARYPSAREAIEALEARCQRSCSRHDEAYFQKGTAR